MTDPAVNTDQGSLANLAARSLIWSLIQNWGGRMMNFLQFVILAHFLSPADFGIAAAAAIVVLFITIIADAGFSDAIIQRHDLRDEDVNLPFFVSMAVSISLAIVTALSAGKISDNFAVHGLDKVIAISAFLAPLTTFSQFQEAIYKRNIAFKKLAFRVFFANIIATFVSIPCAILGLGIWSLIIQSYLVIGIGALWMWVRPLWKPSLVMRPNSARDLLRFGSSVLAMRVLDFGSTRWLEVILLDRFGARNYGFYTASAKLNQTLMDLLQAALNDVSLSLLSKISRQRERIAAAYTVAIAIAGNILPFFFVMVAALSPEICALLFNRQWVGIEHIAMPLFLLGAVQSIQFFSRPYLNARGRSEVVLIISVAKFLFVFSALYFLKSNDILSMVYWFVAAQLLSAPISFAVTARELGIAKTQIYRDLAPVAGACSAAFAAVYLFRPMLSGMEIPEILRDLLLGLCYVATYIIIIILIGRKQLLIARDALMPILRKRLK